MNEEPKYRYFKDDDGARWKCPPSGSCELWTVEDPVWEDAGGTTLKDVLDCMQIDGTVETDEHGEPIKSESPAVDEKPAINTNVRLFDLVRYMRSELHEADLITMEEYAWLCSDAPMAKGAGSPSPRRLEDYDQMRATLNEWDRCAESVGLETPEAVQELLAGDKKELEALRARLKAWEEAFGHLVKSDWFREPEEDPEHGIIVVDTHAPTARKALAYLATPTAPHP